MEWFKEEIMPWLLTFIAGLIALLVKMFLNYVKTVFADKATEQEAIKLLLDGVTATYENYTRAIKSAREDGKLTDEERKEARNKAIQYALGVAQGPVKDILYSWSEERLQTIIRAAVVNLKK